MATRKLWSKAVDDGIKAFKSGEYVYFYGAKCIRLGDDNMDYLIKAEPAYFSRYTAEEIRQIKNNSRGKIGVDCSGFVGWVCTGDKQWSTGQINNCSKYTSVKDGNTGSILYTTWGGKGRHIGIDIGNGYCLQAGYESTDANVKAGRAGIFLSSVFDTAWEKSGESNAVNYSGAHSPYEPTTKLIEEIFGRTEPKRDPEYVAEATTWVNVRTSPEVKNNINGYPLNPMVQYPMLGPGNLVDVCDDTFAPGWSYVRIAGKYFGWVASQYLKLPEPKDPEVGDKVKFVGKKIYASSYSNGKGIEVPNFTAKVTQKNDKAHPYLIKSTGKDGYEGWANKSDLQLI